MMSQEISQDLNKANLPSQRTWREAKNEQKVLIITMSISCHFVIFRSIARWYKTRKIPCAQEDLAMYTALCAFIIQCSLYLAAMPSLYDAEAVIAGEMAPWAGMETDLRVMLQEFIAVLIFFWLTLWAVKASLLLMLKRLTVGLRYYERLWWCVMSFVVLTFIGCVISDILSCSSMHAWLTVGKCSTPRDAFAKAASLWYTLAADLLTDILIMVIPARVLWDLQINLREKLAVGFVFGVGVITMVFGTIRSVSLNSTPFGGQVSTQWHILWGAVEGMVAIIVGCLPTFAVFIRSRVTTSRATNYGSYLPATGPSHDRSIQSARHKALFRIESVQLVDLGNRQINSSKMYGESKRSLVNEMYGGQMQVSQQWTQKWYNGTEEDEERRRIERLGLVSKL